MLTFGTAHVQFVLVVAVDAFNPAFARKGGTGIYESVEELRVLVCDLTVAVLAADGGHAAEVLGDGDELVPPFAGAGVQPRTRYLFNIAETIHQVLVILPDGFI